MEEEAEGEGKAEGEGEEEGEEDFSPSSSCFSRLLLVFPGSILEITCPGILMSGSTSGTLTWDTILLDQGLAKCSPWAKSGPPAVCINKVLLELSHTSSFLYPLWLLWWWKGRAKYLQ